MQEETDGKEGKTHRKIEWAFREGEGINRMRETEGETDTQTVLERDKEKNVREQPEEA